MTERQLFLLGGIFLELDLRLWNSVDDDVLRRGLIASDVSDEEIVLAFIRTAANDNVFQIVGIGDSFQSDLSWKKKF